MSSKRRNAKKDQRRSSPLVLGAVLGGLALVVVSLFWWSGSRSEFRHLPGKWLRTDGGYVIEIRHVTDEGRMDAGYYNPSPINVSKAEATWERGQVNVFIELRDVNYPGSTYALRYNRERDVLDGIYHQAALKQNYTVRFIRME